MLTRAQHASLSAQSFRQYNPNQTRVEKRQTPLKQLLVDTLNVSESRKEHQIQPEQRWAGHEPTQMCQHIVREEHLVRAGYITQVSSMTVQLTQTGLDKPQKHVADMSLA